MAPATIGIGGVIKAGSGPSEPLTNRLPGWLSAASRAQSVTVWLSASPKSSGRSLHASQTSSAPRSRVAITPRNSPAKKLRSPTPQVNSKTRTPAMPAAIQQFPLHSAFFMVTCLSACCQSASFPFILITRRFRCQAKASSPEPRSRRCA